MHNDERFSLAEFAAFLGCGRATAYKLLTTKAVRGYRIGKNWRVSRDEAEQYIRGTSEQPSQPRDQTAA